MIENSIYPKSFQPLGLKDYAPSGTNKDILKLSGLDVDSLIIKIKDLIVKK